MRAARLAQQRLDEERKRRRAAAAARRGNVDGEACDGKAGGALGDGGNGSDDEHDGDCSSDSEWTDDSDYDCGDDDDDGSGDVDAGENGVNVVTTLTKQEFLQQVGGLLCLPAFPSICISIYLSIYLFF